MTDHEREQHDEQQRRWQELAAQLGLDPEPQPGKEGEPAPRAVRAEVTEEPRRQTPPAPVEQAVPLRPAAPPRMEEERRGPEARGQRGRDRQEGLREEPRAVAYRHHKHEAEEPLAQPRAQEELADEDSPVLDEAVKPGAAGERDKEDEPRRRRRRRGRRSSRGVPEREAAAAEAEPETTREVGAGPDAAAEAEAPADSSEEEERGQRRRPRGGRPRGRREETRAEVEEEDEADDKDEPADEAAPEDEDDTPDEMDDLSDWNVPSWQDLIASLYRPER